MVKTYLRYEQHSSFGVISSANAIFGSNGKIAVTAALEDIYLWNIRQGVKLQSLHHPNIKGHVTVLALSPDNVVLAAGYSDGTVCLWDYQLATSAPTPTGDAPEGVFRGALSGHRSEVTCLSFSSDGAVLVSGAMDTELIVWDVVAEQGIMRLNGHRNVVTCCHLIEEERKLISGSKDGLVKVWDLDTQRCIQTLVGHHNPVWALAVSPDNTTLVTGSTDRNLRVWKLGPTASQFTQIKEEESEEVSEETYAILLGTLTRSAIYKDHVAALAFNNDGTLLGCQGSETTFDLFTVFSKDDVDSYKNVKMEDDKKIGYTTSDFFSPLESITAKDKIKSFAFDAATPTRQFMLSLGNNSVQVYKLGAQSQDLLEEQKRNEAALVDSTLSTTIDFEGHPGDIRFVVLSYDDTQILSVSTSCAKVFSSKTRKCTRTIPINEGICGSFIPGVIGTKTGGLFVVELASGQITEVEGAHSSVVWSVCVFPNGQGLASASADKSVKFWAFNLSNGVLSLSHVKTLLVESEATCVCISPNSKHVAVSLMDYTVKIFNMSTLKFFLSLYGHKLPVLSISISSDSTLIATASADKNLKIWGMDFGDCHKSIFAHDGSVTQIAFVPNTHYIFTTGKDKLVKYWDADKFEHIQTLKGHHGEVWGLAISSSGRFVISSSHDRSMRIWEQTDEPLFLEEERENEQDAMFEETMFEDKPFDPEDPTAPRGIETTRPSRATVESIKGSERILEGLGFLREPDSTIAIATLRGRTPEQYIFHTITQLRASEVEEALLLLPYAEVGTLLKVLDAQASTANLRTLETLCRTLFFLLGVHHKQLTLDTKLLPLLLSLNNKVKGALQSYKRVVGVNRAALGIMQKEMEHTEEGFQPLFKIEELQEAKQRKKKKRTKADNVATKQ